MKMTRYQRRGTVWLALVLACLSGCTDDPDGSAPPPHDASYFNVAGLRVAKPLDCRPSAVDGTGSARIDPDTPVHAGTRGSFTVTYEAAKPGIRPGGFVLLQISPFWNWSKPQDRERGFPGFVSVTTSTPDRSIETAVFHWYVLVVSKKRGFEPGETVTFTYENGLVDRYAESEEIFQVMVDGDGDGHYAMIDENPAVTILPREPARLEVHAPSQAEPGETISFSFTALDAIGNWADLPEGEAWEIKVTRNGQEIDRAAKRSGSGNLGSRVARFDFTLPDREGIYFFQAAPAGGSSVPIRPGRSNPLLCREGKPGKRLCFGDIHGHSRLSDGTGTPEDYFAFARTVSRLDICALTDHDHYGTFPIRGKPWERIKRSVNEAYEAGEFVTFLAYEWTNWEFGHRNVYFRDGEGEIFSTADEESRTPEGLWNCLEPYEAMTVAHHSGGGPIRTDWSVPPGEKEWLVEICSIHGSSESFGCKGCIYRPVKGAFVFDALAKGYRLGLIASGDTHDGHPGQRSAGSVTNGILGLFTDELTREAVWDAFKNRHTYATSGKKIILFARFADSPMGSEVELPAGADELPVAVWAVGCEKIEAVDIIRDGRIIGRYRGDGVEARFVDKLPRPPAGTSWYVVRVTQKDGETAWSSPVWVTS